MYMAIMELWERPMYAALKANGKELKASMVRVVKAHKDVFPKDLPSLPLESLVLI